MQTRRDLNASQQLEVVAYWKANKPTIKDLACVFKIKQTTAFQIIHRFRMDENFLVQKYYKETEKEAKT